MLASSHPLLTNITKNCLTYNTQLIYAFHWPFLLQSSVACSNCLSFTSFLLLLSLLTIAGFSQWWYFYIQTKASSENQRQIISSKILILLHIIGQFIATLLIEKYADFICNISTPLSALVQIKALKILVVSALKFPLHIKNLDKNLFSQTYPPSSQYPSSTVWSQLIPPLLSTILFG